MNKKSNNGYLLIFLAGIIWGFIGLFVKLLTSAGADALTIALLRMGFSTVIMTVVSISFYGVSALKIDKKTFIVCAGMGLICQAIYNVLYNLSIQITGVTSAAVLSAVNPVFTAVVSAVVYHEKPSARKLTALLIDVFGCMLAVTNGSIDKLTFGAVGIAVGLAAAFGYSLTPIFAKTIAVKNKPPVISAYSFAFGFIFLMLYSIPTMSQRTLSPRILLYGLLYALIPTCICYLLYYTGLKNITEASRVPVIASAETACASIIGILVFHEETGVFCIIGIILVLLSSALMCEKAK